MMGSKAVEPKLFVSFDLDSRVPRNHALRRITEAVDFQFVRGLVRERYSHTGKPSVDPVVLFKLWLLGYLYNIVSERRLCEEASLNLAWRWFLGYELDEELPDHSVLTKARRRYGTQVYERFFRQIVQLCEERGLVQGDVLFIDSTLSDANAAKDTLRSRSLALQLPEPAQFVRDLQAVNDPPPEPEPPRPKQRRGPQPRERERPPAWRRSLVSTTDPDAELATRRDGRSRLAYKTQVVVDGGQANVITAVEVGAAGDSDSSTVGRLLDKHQVTLGRAPRELVGDSGYGSEPALRECEVRGVTPMLKVRAKAHLPGRFSVDDFIHVAERDVLICPAGEELVRTREKFVLRRAIYQPARRGVCASCPLKAKCTAGRGDRWVRRSWDASLREAVSAQLQTPRGRARLRQRQIVSERVMADLKCKHGFDRAQFRGRPSVQIQALLTAAVFNLKLLAKRRPEPQAGSATRLLAVATEVPGRVYHALSGFLNASRLSAAPAIA